MHLDGQLKDSPCFKGNGIGRCWTPGTVAGQAAQKEFHGAHRPDLLQSVLAATVTLFLISIAELTSPAFGLCSHHATQIEILGWQWGLRWGGDHGDLPSC